MARYPSQESAVPSYLKRQPPSAPKRKQATLRDIERSLRPNIPGVTVCMNCGRHLDFVPEDGVKYCRNPKCDKYVESAFMAARTGRSKL